MGACRICSKDAGWLSSECSDCRAQREAAEKAKLAADREAAEQERQANIDAMVESAVGQLTATADAGGTTYLYETLTLDLDGGWIDGRGLDQLRDLGRRGWEILNSSPHFSMAAWSGNDAGAIRFEQTSFSSVWRSPRAIASISTPRSASTTRPLPPRRSTERGFPRPYTA
jgi:hypothetical protein